MITGTIKSNFPSRIAFKVMSQIDSRTILDTPGANRLIGKGDMLILITGSSEPTRVQCAFVDTPEVEDIVNYVGAQVAYPTAYLLPEYIGEGGESSSAGSVDLSDRDPLFDEAARLIVIQQQGSDFAYPAKVRNRLQPCRPPDGSAGSGGHRRAFRRQ